MKDKTELILTPEKLCTILLLIKTEFLTIKMNIIMYYCINT